MVNHDDKSSQTMTLPVENIGVGDRRKNVIYERPIIPEVNSLKMELEKFVESLLSNEEPLVSGSDGLRALEVADIILGKMNH